MLGKKFDVGIVQIDSSIYLVRTTLHLKDGSNIRVIYDSCYLVLMNQRGSETYSGIEATKGGK
jgi:hypothetical protein